MVADAHDDNDATTVRPVTITVMADAFENVPLLLMLPLGVEQLFEDPLHLFMRDWVCLDKDVACWSTAEANGPWIGRLVDADDDDDDEDCLV